MPNTNRTPPISDAQCPCFLLGVITFSLRNAWRSTSEIRPEPGHLSPPVYAEKGLSSLRRQHRQRPRTCDPIDRNVVHALRAQRRQDVRSRRDCAGEVAVGRLGQALTTQAWGPRRPAMGRVPEWRWADPVVRYRREAHPPTVEETKPTKPSHDQAREGKAPEQT